jgi:hypothetical protein
MSTRKRDELFKQVEYLWNKLFQSTAKPQVDYLTEITDVNTDLIFRTDPLPAPAWDPWEIDAEFVKTLSRWNEDHPEHTLERVFAKINTGLENAQPLLQLIPDSPFPARSLVTALAHLVNLGLVCRSHLSLCYLMTILCRK